MQRVSNGMQRVIEGSGGGRDIEIKHTSVLVGRECVSAKHRVEGRERAGARRKRAEAANSG